MDYPSQVKAFLWDDIFEMSQEPGRFAKNPSADFTRRRKLFFEDLLRFLITMQSGTTNHELLKYFNFGVDTLSSSAFYQQRNKLLPEVFPHLLHQFNSHFPLVLYKNKYNLVAIDGSEFNIARNPDDPDTFHPSNGQSLRGFNMLHTISLYDILSKRYLDCIIQPGRKKNEFRAICDLTDRYSYPGAPIFIGDRGFSSYNFYAHAQEKSTLYIIRSKDIIVKRLLNLQTLPDQLDTSVDIILSRSHSKKKMHHPELADLYRYISPEVAFDYIEPGSDDEYALSLRVVRFEVADGIFENVITNLPAHAFLSDELKYLYNLRWNIETSYRDLKHTIGTTNFHSKKVEYINAKIIAS